MVIAIPIWSPARRLYDYGGTTAVLIVRAAAPLLLLYVLQMVTPHPPIIDCFRMNTLPLALPVVHFGANPGSKSTCIYTGILFSVSRTGSL